jgi:hypothetical protein
MALSEMDIEEVVSELGGVISGLAITTTPIGELPLKNSHDLLTDLRSGAYDVTLGYLRESLRSFNRNIEIPLGWELEIAVLDGTQPQGYVEIQPQGYVEIMWRVKKRAGSIGLPHVPINDPPHGRSLMGTISGS